MLMMTFFVSSFPILSYLENMCAGDNVFRKQTEMSALISIKALTCLWRIYIRHNNESVIG